MQRRFVLAALALIPGFLLALTLMVTSAAPLSAQAGPDLAAQRARLWAERSARGPTLRAPASLTPCTGGFAGIYPCENVDLLAFVPIGSIGGGAGNDVWGWTDPETGREYALMGRTSGTAFVDVTDPLHPVYLGNLPTETVNSIWRDIKTRGDHAYIVADNAGAHGIQIFDLRRLRDVASPPVTFEADAVHSGIGSAHNVVIEPSRPFVYAVGSDQCSGGLYMSKISNPTSLAPGTCYTAAYTHDAMCTVYRGPDEAHQGKDICFDADGSTRRLAIVDVTNKSAAVDLARVTYPSASYTHQGWLTENQRYFLLNDEGDELLYGFNTRTAIFDVTDLDNPIFLGSYTGPVASIDHNLYVRDYYAFEANYSSGLRILDITNIGEADLSEVAYFDSFPQNNSPNYSGAWSTYPFFSSRIVLLSDESGLFILQPRLPLEFDAALAESQATASPGETVLHGFVLANLRAGSSYSLTLGGGSWPSTLLTASPIMIATDDTDLIEVAVELPASAAEGLRLSDTMTLTATSVLSPALTVSAAGTTLADVQVDLTLGPDAGRAGKPGAVVSHTLVLTNTGTATDTIQLMLTGADWPTTLTPTTVALGPGQTAFAQAQVTIPLFPQGAGADPRLLGSDALTVTARSTIDPSVSAEAQRVTNALAEIAFDLAPAYGQGELGGVTGWPVTHTLRLENQTILTDTYTLSVSDNGWPTEPGLATVELPPGGSALLPVVVTVGPGQSDSALITATSGLDPAVSRAVTLTTSTRLFFMPFFLGFP